jgi:hypothetical protein
MMSGFQQANDSWVRASLLFCRRLRISNSPETGRFGTGRPGMGRFGPKYGSDIA